VRQHHLPYYMVISITSEEEQQLISIQVKAKSWLASLTDKYITSERKEATLADIKSVKQTYYALTVQRQPYESINRSMIVLTKAVENGSISEVIKELITLREELKNLAPLVLL